ncbi:MAG: cardiolipin synthase [Chromatiaceae bacterium]|nr:MAG: cardiolipin synthase [Chromatiaceae bacterium]
MFTALFLSLLHLLLQGGLILRALLRPHRDPAARMAWVLVIAALPLLGLLAYLLFGEVNLGRRRIARMQATLARLPVLADTPGMAAAMGAAAAAIPAARRPLFQLGASIGEVAPVAGNRGRLLADSDAAIAAMVADIDAARDHVHLLFYIWLPDHNGTRMAESLQRAAARGVRCRVLVDDLGSRLLPRSPLWSALAAAGVRLERALPVGNPLLRPLRGRIDLRNHRKVVVIDGCITYCGSQNCADPAFRIKPRFAPWVDLMLRFEGPIARQNQALFAADWMAHTDEDLSALLTAPLAPLPAPPTALPAQVIGTGPTLRYAAMPELFQTLMYAARQELVISTPYYVPDEAMQAALCAAARRGCETHLILPARNDSALVAAASRACYADLLAAGVVIHEYQGGLLHSKSLTLDGELALIGSANLDRRSFDLNYENNILFYDPPLTAAIRARQDSYIAAARPVTAATVAAWPRRRRLWNNVVAMLGPLL